MQQSNAHSWCHSRHGITYNLIGVLCTTSSSKYKTLSQHDLQPNRKSISTLKHRALLCTHLGLLTAYRGCLVPALDPGLPGRCASAISPTFTRHPSSYAPASSVCLYLYQHGTSNMRSIPIWRASTLPLVQRWSISGTRTDGHGNSITSQTPAMRIRFGMPFWPVLLKSLQMHSTGD